MPTVAAPSHENEAHVSTILESAPLWERLMAEYWAVGEINGWEDDFRSNSLDSDD